MKQRIWELDALRGLCICGMVIVHLFYDLITFGGMKIAIPQWAYFVQEYGHVLFVLISGICVTLGKKSVKRGLYVLCAALLISYVTLFAEAFFAMRNLRIWFGILHLLGFCMVLYPLFKRLPHWVLAVIGLAFVALGFWMKGLRVDVDFLFPLGLRSGRVFTGSDFFPLFPGLGWFLLGAAIGKSVYVKKCSLLPDWSRFFRFFSFCGRHSLEIYMIHQPVLAGIVLFLV